MTWVSWRGTSASRSMPSPPTWSTVRSTTVTGTANGRPAASSTAAIPVNVQPGLVSAASMKRKGVVMTTIPPTRPARPPLTASVPSVSRPTSTPP